ncbi:MAG: ester cyclase [Dehalococcoidales bacterium]|nr:ester cyclase [Dehalococcoidales bacterium]
MPSNREIVETFCSDVFVRQDLSRLDEYMRDDYIQHNDVARTGKDGFLEFFVGTFKALPDFRYTILQTVAEGDIVMVHSTMTATHTGGAWLSQPATGNSLEINVVDIFRVQDGMIAEHWDVADTLTLFTQLGLAERLPAVPD